MEVVPGDGGVRLSGCPLGPILGEVRKVSCTFERRFEVERLRVRAGGVGAARSYASVLRHVGM